MLSRTFAISDLGRIRGSPYARYMPPFTASVAPVM
jgi:hypothetical protein